MVTKAKTCDACHEVGQLQKCSKCEDVWYCGKACQKSAWIRHKFSCRIGRALDSADYLVLDCFADEYPQEPSVLEDFGFHHFHDFKSRSNILGLFIGLVCHLDVGDRQLHRWQIAGTLKKNIIAKFSILPQGSRGGYFPWFLEHDWIFEPAKTTTKHDQVSAWAKSANHILDEEDRARPLSQLQPEAKLDAFLFYSALLQGWSPAPGMPTWICLGFCTRRNQWAENQLAGMYQQLIAKCSFHEFWEAMGASEMLRLLDKYDLTKVYREFRNFEVLMKSIIRRPSVWDLKEFCQMDEPNPIKAVIVDYGFMYCKDAGDRRDLKRAYQTFFERGGDEMELHDACLKGSIYEYLRGKQPLEPKYRHLMRNLYPLAVI